MQVPAAAVAAEVIKDGGSVEQAWVAAALVSGIESDGDPTELAGGRGPAAGLFQFEPGTWQSHGGGAYGKVAQDASWQDQVLVFLNATQGNHFGAWGPDLVANRGNPNSASNPAYGYAGPPQPGSAVANKIASLAAGGTLSFLGNVPASWADAGGATPANPLPGPVGAVAGFATGGTSSQIPGTAGLAAIEQGVSTLLGDVTSASWWERVGMGALGLLLFGIGLAGFLSTTKPGQKATSDAGTALKDGAVAAAVA